MIYLDKSLPFSSCALASWVLLKLPNLAEMHWQLECWKVDKFKSDVSESCRSQLGLRHFAEPSSLQFSPFWKHAFLYTDTILVTFQEVSASYFPPWELWMRLSHPRSRRYCGAKGKVSRAAEVWAYYTKFDADRWFMAKCWPKQCIGLLAAGCALGSCFRQWHDFRLIYHRQGKRIAKWNVPTARSTCVQNDYDRRSFPLRLPRAGLDKWDPQWVRWVLRQIRIFSCTPSGYR